MLHIRGVINVALCWVLANVKIKRVDFIGQKPQTTVPGTHDQGEAGRQRSRQTEETTVQIISKNVSKSAINVS